jgi:phosphoglucomutase
MPRHRLAGRLPTADLLIDPDRLRHEYFASVPDPADPAQRVVFGTSGHRGSSLHRTFNDAHVAAITQAVCDHRQQQGVAGPLYMGADTHALSQPAFCTALEVLAANQVDTFVDSTEGATPTPVVSHAIVTYNRGRTSGLADGIVMTPSHNPPEDGGFKYNPPHGGPADTGVTRWIEARANALLSGGPDAVRRIPLRRARRAATTHTVDYLRRYIDDLASVIDVDAIRSSGLTIGVDPLGGASAKYWRPIAERYGLHIEVVNDAVDPTFRFMPLDWDGRIRMDCSSPDAMARLIALKDRFDLAFGNDPDSDRHGIVTRAGLMNPNHYLAAAIFFLFTHRPGWSPNAAVGKTIVSSSAIDRVAAKVRRRLVEVPVGFKWFVPGLLDGSLAFGGEESAGASFQRRDGTVWTTDKDGIILNLLAAEITAMTQRNPAELYGDITSDAGALVYERVDAPATAEQKAALIGLTSADIRASELAGDPIETVLTTAPGNGAAIGGLKVVTAYGWFAARPSGTEDVYKLYAESFRGREHLRRIQNEAQALLTAAFARASSSVPAGAAR